MKLVEIKKSTVRELKNAIYELNGIDILLRNCNLSKDKEFKDKLCNLFDEDIENIKSFINFLMNAVQGD